MKKKVLGILAVCSLTASAQVTIKPQLSAGLSRTYHLKGYNTAVNQNATDSFTYSADSVLELFGKTIENGRTMQKVGDEEVEVSYRLSTDGHTVEAESEPDPQTVVKKHFVFGNDGWPVNYSLSTTINMGEDMGKITLETDAVLTDAQ